MDHIPPPTRVPAERAIDPDRWLDLHGDHLYRYALLRVGRPETAADLVQETLLAALERRDSFDGRSEERTWLLAILKYKTLDHYRRAAREPAAFEPETLDGLLSGPFSARGFWRSMPEDPTLRLERRELYEHLTACLSRLPPHLAAPFAMRELDGMSSEQICQELGISATNLWARLHRARLLLRACLEKHWSGERGESK